MAQRPGAGNRAFGRGRRGAEVGLSAVYRLNNAGHDRIFGACGNPCLAATIALIAWLSHAIRAYRIADPMPLRQARHEHGAVIAALRTGDVAARPSMPAAPWCTHANLPKHSDFNMLKPCTMCAD